MPVAPSSDRGVLRELVERYLAVCSDPVMDERRKLWAQLHSLKPTRPLIYMRGGRVFSEVPELRNLVCEDPFFRGYEHRLRLELYRAGLDDDTIFEPWLTVRPSFACGGWGVGGGKRTQPDMARGAWKEEYPLREPADIDKLREPWHEINEERTAELVGKVQDAVGDLIEINLDRGPAYTGFAGDISTALGHLRGIENFMLDMYDNPEWLHRLCKFMGEGALRTHEQAEDAGDWCLSSGQNQAETYAEELPAPEPNSPGATRSQLWGYYAAQEFTLVSPAMHEEFLLQYQLLSMRKFGLVAYGCCEDLGNKIDMLRQIPNLRRIAVAPAADVRTCAEQIGQDYVMSYRPSPADMVCCGYDEARIERIVGDALEVCRGQFLDITLKDVDTAQNEPERLRNWVACVRRIIDRNYR